MASAKVCSPSGASDARIAPCIPRQSWAEVGLPSPARPKQVLRCPEPHMAAYASNAAAKRTDASARSGTQAKRKAPSRGDTLRHCERATCAKRAREPNPPTRPGEEQRSLSAPRSLHTLFHREHGLLIYSRRFAHLASKSALSVEGSILYAGVSATAACHYQLPCMVC